MRRLFAINSECPISYTTQLTEKEGITIMKLAMLNCLKSNRVCTGAACLQALNERKKSFAQYKGQNIELTAFMRCNGCDIDPEGDKGIIEKMDRLQKIGTEVLHVGVCTVKKEGGECPTITKMIEMAQQRGIRVVRGTH